MLVTQQAFHNAGSTVDMEAPRVWDLGASIVKNAAGPELSYSLSGRLYLSKSGWILLTVPNDLAHGAFKALNEPGIEMPEDFNAHISVMRPEELEQIGGPDVIDERGKSFRYTLGPLRSVEPAGWPEMSKVWFIEVNSPELSALRKSYGLPALPNENKFKFHITVAVRKKNVLRESEVRKAACLLAALGDL